MKANYFDFHYLYVTCTRIKPLLAAGFDRQELRGRVNYVSGKYPVKSYEASVHGSLEELEKKQVELLKMGVTSSIRYHCAD